ncbi:MAG: hypothetical protein GY862_19465 [Gammaproteobacteria bacterium]|nr:hypothetical protein [Gammaproteobacteria bacterium]
MSFNKSARYVLRHAWLWPLVFWMRPMMVVRDAIEHDRRETEIFCALLGGAAWGLISGLVIWYFTDNHHAFWILAVSAAVSFTVAFAVAGAAVFADDVAGDFLNAVAGLAAIAEAIDNTAITVVAVVSAIATAVAVAGTGDFADAGDFVAAVVFIGIGAFVGTVIGATVVVIANAFAEAIVSASAAVGASAGTGAGVGLGVFMAIIYFILGGIGITASFWFNPSVLGVGIIGIVSTVAILSIWELLSLLFKKKDIPDWAGMTWFMLWWFVLPLCAFALFPRLRFDEVVIWGTVFTVVLGIGSLAIFFYYKQTDSEYLSYALLYRKLSNHEQQENIYAGFVWVFYPLLALGIWWFDPNTPGLNEKLDLLALFLVLIAPLITGLPFYPLLALNAWYQSRPRYIQRMNKEQFNRLTPLRWQSFVYPLPSLYTCLRNLARYHGMATTVQILQDIQLQSLQTQTAARAALKLANTPETALAFCGQVAIQSNAATLTPLSPTGRAAQAVAILARKAEKEEEQPLWLYFDVYPHKLSDQVAFFDRLNKTDSLAGKYTSPLHGFKTMRAQALVIRVAYALEALTYCENFVQATEFHTLLKALQACVEARDVRALSSLNREAKFARSLMLAHCETSAQTADFHNFVEAMLAFVKAGNVRASSNLNREAKPAGLLNTSLIYTEADDAWLVYGGQMLKDFNGVIADLNDYREFTGVAARREFLDSKVRALQALSMDKLPKYWANIAMEIKEYWTTLLWHEAKQAKEWLVLTAELPAQTIRTGQHTLLLEIRNTSGVLARNLLLQVENTPGLHYAVDKIKHRFLEGGQHTQMHLPVESEQVGDYRLQGTLQAEDSDGVQLKNPFSFRLEIGKAGKPYQPPEYAIYTTGEGLGDDRTFVGRAELLQWLRSLWRQPHGKPAVVLMGQRRIGKTSLLNKIQREGLKECRLLPVLVNIQGNAGEYDFLRETAQKMAQSLELPPPVLDKQEPRADFKSFLLALKKPLAEKRFLLMLDEADLMPSQHLGTLPGFLRALMQEPEYPVLLLFCGTHALKRMGRDYSSILFNTAQMRTVSYLTESEAGELLEKPARKILEFDPAVLREAYRLTRGQPLLLQLLGDTLIRQFNAVVFGGGERGNFVNLKDLEQAAEVLARQSNAAFENHWHDSDTAVHRVLSALAWATDEHNRKQLDIEGIAAAMQDNRLELPRNTLFQILERLTEEEILVNEGPTYRYAVPLYRRWTAWRWEPLKVREEEL